jgi:hypothetical protein
MIAWSRIAASFLFGATLLSGAALADSADDGMNPEQKQVETKFLTSVYGDPAPKARERVCFTRLYDAAHLKAHPNQKVVEIRISLHYTPKVRPATDSTPAGTHWGYAIHTLLRSGKQKTFLDDGSSGNCYAMPSTSDNPRGAAFVVRCNAACDAGDDLTVDLDGKRALLSNKLDLVHPERDGPGADPKEQAKLDDSTFRIYRASDANCAFDKP